MIKQYFEKMKLAYISGLIILNIYIFLLVDHEKWRMYELVNKNKKKKIEYYE